MTITTILFVIACGQKIGSCVTKPMAEYGDVKQCARDVRTLDSGPAVPGIAAYWCESVKRRKRK